MKQLQDRCLQLFFIMALRLSGVGTDGAVSLQP